MYYDYWNLFYCYTYYLLLPNIYLAEFSVQFLYFMVEGLDFIFQCQGFKRYGYGIRVYFLCFKGQGLVFFILGLGLSFLFQGLGLIFFFEGQGQFVFFRGQGLVLICQGLGLSFFILGFRVQFFYFILILLLFVIFLYFA